MYGNKAIIEKIDRLADGCLPPRFMMQNTAVKKMPPMLSHRRVLTEKETVKEAIYSVSRTIGFSPTYKLPTRRAREKGVNDRSSEENRTNDNNTKAYLATLL